VKLTYTHPDHFSGSLPKIPTAPAKQIALLEHAVADLIERLMEETGGDNPGDVIDLLADECNQIAWRAWDRSCERNKS
jgi:hypothetical protein